jgi:hypothetical protein
MLQISFPEYAAGADLSDAPRNWILLVTREQIVLVTGETEACAGVKVHHYSYLLFTDITVLRVLRVLARARVTRI